MIGVSTGQWSNMPFPGSCRLSPCHVLYSGVTICGALDHFDPITQITISEYLDSLVVPKGYIVFSGVGALLAVVSYSALQTGLRLSRVQKEPSGFLLQYF